MVHAVKSTISYASMVSRGARPSVVGASPVMLPGSGYRPDEWLRNRAVQNHMKSTLGTIVETSEESPLAKALATDLDNHAVKDAITPSEAPGRSTFRNGYNAQSHAPTRVTRRSRQSSYCRKGWTESKVCIKSTRNRDNFKRGQIITLPFHVPNLNDKVSEDDPNLAFTLFGPVYTKRRMAVVLWRYQSEMMCLPLYSFSGRGLIDKPEGIRHQYMEITNMRDVDHHNQLGKYKVLAAETERALKPRGVVALSGGFRVDYQEDIAIAGELSKPSRDRLLNTWNELMLMHAPEDS